MDMVQPSDQGEEDAANATAQKSTMKESTMKAIVYHKYGSPDVLALEEVGVLPREGRFRAAMNDALKDARRRAAD